MNPKVSKHSWSEESLFQKAKLYFGQLEKHETGEWQFGFWSSLVLEHLARASLSRFSPALLLGNKCTWQHIAYSLGIEGFSYNHPQNISFNEVIERLNVLLPNLNEYKSYCNNHAQRRNKELHSGELAFENITEENWLQKFYIVCQILLHSIEKDLEDFVSEPEQVRELINNFKASKIDILKQTINDHKKCWGRKKESERVSLTEEANGWATRDKGHRVICPSCGSTALIKGVKRRQLDTEIKGDQIIKKFSMQPSEFKCEACKLQIIGQSDLLNCGLGNSFTGTYVETAAEYFNLHTEEELEEAFNWYPEMEPDFNE